MSIAVPPVSSPAAALGGGTRPVDAVLAIDSKGAIGTTSTGGTPAEIAEEAVLVRLSRPYPTQTLVPLRLAPAAAGPTHGGVAAPGATGLSSSAAMLVPGNVELGAVARALAAAPSLSSALTPLSNSGAAPMVSLAKVSPPLISVVAVNPAQPEALGHALQSALRACGAFYESHQAQWVEGRFPEDTLRAESRIRTSAGSSGAASSGGNMPSPPLSPPLSSSFWPASASAVTTAPMPAITPTALPALDATVGAQLHCLETGELRLVLQPWPGQFAELVFRRDEPGGHASGGPGDGPPEPAIDTRMELALPQLGGVGVQLRMQGPRAWLTVSAEDAVTATTLQSEIATLAATLESQGIRLMQAEVQHAD